MSKSEAPSFQEFVDDIRYITSRAHIGNIEERMSGFQCLTAGDGDLNHSRPSVALHELEPLDTEERTSNAQIELTAMGEIVIKSGRQGAF